MVTGSCLFLLGVLSLLRFPSLPPLWPVWLLPPLVFIAFRFPWLRRPAWLVCGFLWALLFAHARMERVLDPHWQGVPLEVEGKVASLPEEEGRYVRFDVSAAAVAGPDGQKITSPGRIRLNWYQPYPAVVPGDRFRLTVRLKRPHGYRNPGGFDYEGWLFQQGVGARGYVVDGERLEPSGLPAWLSIHRWRYRLRQQLDALQDRFSRPSLIKTLGLGDRGDVTREQWQVLGRTGTNHLLAISGLHIGLVAGIAWFLAVWIWPLFGRSALRLPAPHAAAIAALSAAAAYAMLAGLTLPTRRALIMIGVLLLSRLVYRPVNRKTAFSLALLAVLFVDPFAVLSPGLWLSFGAVAVILLALSAPLQPFRRAARFVRIQWFVFLGLAPLLAFWFHQVPLLSMLANGLAIPWISLVSVPLVVAGTLLLPLCAPVAGWLLDLGDQSLGLIWQYLEWLAGLDFNLWLLSRVTLPALLAGLVGVLLLLMPRATPAKWTGILWLLPLLFPHIDRPEEGALRFTLLDVGQGLAAVVQTRNHVLTYDTGPAYGSGFNTGWAVVVPFLQQAGIRRVDVHVQSHGDNDHRGGLEDLLAMMPVEKIVSSDTDGISHSRVEACRRGMQWRWDGVRFRVLHPRPSGGLSGNNRSCVLKISTREHSVLLPGDIERSAERLLTADQRRALDSTVLVVPHHGSLSSSGSAFVRAVSPSFALFPVGYLNRYRLPKQAIIERYRKGGAVVFDTARAGAIQLRIAAADIQVRSYREETRRFWHNQP